MAAAALRLRKSGKSRAMSSTQGWSPDPQRISRGVLLTCSFPSKVSSHLRAVSHYLNRISKPAHSLPLHWISYQMVWFSTRLLGKTRSSLLRMPWISTSQLGTMRHHSQGTILNLTSSLTLNCLTLSAETMPCRDWTLLMCQTFRCQTHQQYMTLLHQDASLEDDAASGASVHNLPQVNASVLPVIYVRNTIHTWRGTTPAME